MAAAIYDSVSLFLIPDPLVLACLIEQRASLLTGFPFAVLVSEADAQETFLVMAIDPMTSGHLCSCSDFEVFHFAKIRPFDEFGSEISLEIEQVEG